MYLGKVDKPGYLWDKGTVDASLIRYIAGLSNVLRQGKKYLILSQKKCTQHQHSSIKKHLNLQLS